MVTELLSVLLLNSPSPVSGKHWFKNLIYFFCCFAAHVSSVVGRLGTLRQTKWSPLDFHKNKKKNRMCIILTGSWWDENCYLWLHSKQDIYSWTNSNLLFFFFSLPNSLPRLKTSEACIYMTLDFISWSQARAFMPLVSPHGAVLMLWLWF